MDFTLKKYRQLITVLKECGIPFIGFSDLAKGGCTGFIVLRHDVDRKPENALNMARAEAEEGIKASYHFRAPGGPLRDRFISGIAGLGHEIAYHYEDFSAVAGRGAAGRGFTDPSMVDAAVSRFRSNLADLRGIVPVTVISMHGSPLSTIDNRLLWKYFDYRTEGIVCEPYFNVDVSDVLYLTDTGRSWDSERSVMRDRGLTAGEVPLAGGYEVWKVKPVRGSLMDMTPEGLQFREKFRIRKTDEMIDMALSHMLPSRMIINTHPQRWNNDIFGWFTELIMQNLKNPIKVIVRGSKNFYR